MHGVQIAEAVNAVFSPNVETVISRSENFELYGGVIYDLYSGSSICMHNAGFKSNWANRSLLWLVFAYPFLQLNCKIVIARVPSTNAQALKLNEHLGFKELCRIPDAVPDGDIVIMVMRREECRWLQMKQPVFQVMQHEPVREKMYG